MHTTENAPRIEKEDEANTQQRVVLTLEMPADAAVKFKVLFEAGAFDSIPELASVVSLNLLEPTSDRSS